jgi:hypothetical protein
MEQKKRNTKKGVLEFKLQLADMNGRLTKGVRSGLFTWWAHHALLRKGNDLHKVDVEHGAFLNDIHNVSKCSERGPWVSSPKHLNVNDLRLRSHVQSDYTTYVVCRDYHILILN